MGDCRKEKQRTAGGEKEGKKKNWEIETKRENREEREQKKKQRDHEKKKQGGRTLETRSDTVRRINPSFFFIPSSQNRR